MDGHSESGGPGVKWKVSNIEWFVGKVDGPNDKRGQSYGRKWTVQRMNINDPIGESGHVIDISPFSYNVIYHIIL